MPRSSLVGQTLGGRYRIEEMVGQGGMSAVYKARDPNLKRVVAIKMIHGHLAADPRFLVRFEEEATAVAQLRHPNIIQVFDYNHDDELYYMVQEFVAGETLQERLRRLNKAGKRMPLSEAIEIALQTSDAAHYAHGRGMIHRDIKPANIMLDLHGQAILMDFGIVKITGGESHTATGAVVGTALYMPPELVQGQTPDGRSDLYSLGVTLFEMVSGRPPFEADSTLTLMMMHLNNAPPDLRSLRPGVPEALIAVIEKALAKDRDDRYASMAHFSAALRRAREQMEMVATPGATALEEPKASVAPTPPAGASPAASGQKAPAAAASGSPRAADTPQAGPGPVVAAPSEQVAAEAPLRARPKMSPAIWIGGALVMLAILAGVLFALLRSPGQDGAASTPPGGAAQATLPAATGPAGLPLARITGITLDGQQRYVVAYETSGQPSDAHLHFFFDTLPPEQAGTPGSGLWTDYAGSSPFAQIKQSERPENAGQMCVLVANPDHSVQPSTGSCSVLPDVVTAAAEEDTACLLGPAAAFPPAAQLKAGQAAIVLGLSPDEAWWNVANPQQSGSACWLPVAATQVSGDISTLPLVEGPPLPNGTPPVDLSVEIRHIGLDDQGRYVVDFETTGFTAQLPGTHIHFFFDTVPPEQAGVSGEGLRLMYGGPPPFTGYTAADRPAEAGQMCALVANPDHSVLPDSGNCMMLPDAP